MNRVVTLRALKPPPPPAPATVQMPSDLREAFDAVDSQVSRMRPTFAGCFATTTRLAVLPVQIEALEAAVARLRSFTTQSKEN